MKLVYNTIQKVQDLAPGDRFHLVGKKNTRGAVIEQFLGDNPAPGAMPVKTIVLMDGETFTKKCSPLKEVIFLRHKSDTND
jgi:hypothetical protein